MRPMNIRLRLTLWYGAVMTTLLVGFSVAVYGLMRQHLLAFTDAALAEETADLAGDVGRCRSESALSQELGLRYASHDGYEFQVTGKGGRVLFRSDGLGRAGVPIPRFATLSVEPAYQTLGHDRNRSVRLANRIASGPSGPVAIQAAVSLAPNDHALRNLLAVLLSAGPLTLAGALGGGYLLAQKALAPVGRMAATAAQITATRLDRRLEASHPGDELGRLAGTFNDMIARLERSFEEVRRFTADAAHELRTPLSMMRTEAEVALRAPREPERDGRVLEDLLEEIDRLSRLVTLLLFLCREDSGLATGETRPLRLDDVVRDVVDHMQVAAREKEVALEAGTLQPCHVCGDADRLRQLLFNVVDNAIKFTPPGGSVAVRCEVRDGWANVVVSDTGAGIPAEHLPRVFDRFYRVDPSRNDDAGGTGLGLAIVRSIAEAHGGRIGIESDFGHGTTIAVTLPTSDNPVKAMETHSMPRLE